MARVISAIVACDVNGGIGKDGKIPWYDRSETLWFKGVTMDKPCIMGRKTYESLPAPLRGRRNIVLTTTEEYGTVANVTCVNNVHQALEEVEDYPEAMVCGGAEIYKLFLPFCNRVYMSIIPSSLDCDTFFEEPTVDCGRLPERYTTTPSTRSYIRGKHNVFQRLPTRSLPVRSLPTG